MKNSCETRTNNTASSRCVSKLGLYRKVVIIPVSATYTGFDDNRQPQTVEEWLIAGIHAADPKKRFYPMPQFSNIEDQTEDNVVYTNAYGRTTPIRDGNVGFLQSFDLDHCLNKRLLAFSNQTFRAIIFDNDNNAQFTQKGQDLTGMKCNIFVSMPRPNTPTELSEPTIQYSFLDASENRKTEIVQMGIDWGDVNGLEDLELNIIKEGGQFYITFGIACSGEDVTGELRALDNEAIAWVVKDENGTEQPISPPPSFDPTRNAFVVTSLPPNGMIGLANPQVLYELGIGQKDCPRMTQIPM